MEWGDLGGDVLDAFLRDFEDALAFGKVGAVNDPRDPGVPLALSQEDAVGAEVGEDVSTCGLVGGPEEGVGRRDDLVGHDHGDVKDFSHSEELV